MTSESFKLGVEAGRLKEGNERAKQAGGATANPHVQLANTFIAASSVTSQTFGEIMGIIESLHTIAMAAHQRCDAAEQRLAMLEQSEPKKAGAVE